MGGIGGYVTAAVAKSGPVVLGLADAAGDEINSSGYTRTGPVGWEAHGDVATAVGSFGPFPAGVTFAAALIFTTAGDVVDLVAFDGAAALPPGALCTVMVDVTQVAA